jgi:enterochelin esterase-like enzyme
MDLLPGPRRCRGRMPFRGGDRMMLFALALAAATGVPHGTMQRLEIRAPEVGDARRTVRVYLPPSYDRPDHASRRYPVIYLLHGWPGSDGNWVTMGHASDTADSLIASGRIPEVILVFPNGGGKGLLGRSGWMNSYDGTSRVEDFVAGRVVRWVDSTFRTQPVPERRAVIGLSDGGTGAVNLVLRHLDEFRACGSHSGEFLLKKDLGIGGVVGPEPAATLLLQKYSPMLYIDQLMPLPKDLVIYLDCGTADEDLEDNRAFHAKLLKLGVPHAYNEFPGTHEWRYWRTHLVQSLVAVTANMR